MNGAPSENAPNAPIAFRYELWRKAIHLASTIYPVAYAWFLSRATMIAVLLASCVVALGIEGARRVPGGRRLFEQLTGAILRQHERSRAVGATWLLLSFAAVVIATPRPVAIAAMCAVSLGDAAAALIGRSLGRVRFPRTGKTLEGAAACFIVTLLAARWVGDLATGAAAIAAIAATLAELPSGPGDDNARVALVTAAAAWAGMLVFGMAASAVS